jgi:diketogulonate reductase-like aldo/keto reductase
MPAIPRVELADTGETVPEIGLGTWQMERDDRRECVEALRRGVELGADLIDTAEMYGSGDVERIVSDAIDGLRDEVFLVTKVLPRNASREGTIEACRASLDRLGTDHVDLYLLHWSSPHPTEDTMAAFRDLLDEGLTRHVGVSNLSWGEFQRADEALGPERSLVTDQVLYWLGARNAENELLPNLAERDVPLMAYSPLGQGGIPEPGTEKRRVLEDIAKAHDATVPQVMLAWVTRHEHAFAIPKTSSVDHLEENLGAVDVDLTSADLDRIDEVYPNSGETRLQSL